MSVQHKGKVIPILIVGDVGDCWEAYVAGGLKRIPKELAFLMTPASSNWW
jgi:hypothetical protein